MRIHSGIIKLNKTDIKVLETLIKHVELDLSYNEGGTYNDGEDEVDKKAVRQAEDAIFIIRQIIRIN